MSFVASAIVASVAIGAITANKQQAAAKKAQKKAKEDAIEADIAARKAETFAETEGAGIGNLGTISLEVDEDEETETQIKSSNVRI